MTTPDINALILDIDGSEMDYVPKQGAPEEPYKFKHLIRLLVNINDPRDDEFDKAMFVGIALASQKAKFTVSPDQAKLLVTRVGRHLAPIILYRTCEWLGVDMPSRTPKDAKPDAS